MIVYTCIIVYTSTHYNYVGESKRDRENKGRKRL